MPTVSWILETAEDRYFERGGDGIRQVAPTFRCPICDTEFADPVQVSWHVSDAHPLERPLLFVNGAAAPSSVVYSAHLDPATIVFSNTTGIRATCNGRAIAAPNPSDLAKRIASEPQAIFHIELENSRAEDRARIKAEYVITTSVPDEADIEAVDGLFAQYLVVDGPTLSDIRAFADAAGRYISADRYADGLVAYVLGILAKEGDPAAGATLPFDAFQSKMQRALEELEPHRSRPVAQAVCATVKLNVNDVRGWLPPLGDPALVGSLALLQRLANNEDPRPAPDPAEEARLTPTCPIDRDTHLVLRAYNHLYGDAAHANEGAADEYAARAEDATLSPFDRTKLHAMLAAHLLDVGERLAANGHLNALIYDPVFGRWSQRALEGVE